MQIVLTRTTPIFTTPETSGVFVQWQVNEPPTTSLTFHLERGGSPEGPFELVAAGLTGFHYYDPHEMRNDLDEEALNLLSLQRRLYYRVTATGTLVNPASATAVVGDELPMRQALLRRKIQRDIRISFKFNTIPCAVLKRKHWGVRCTACFDKLTKLVTQSKCMVCFGTGFVEGYHAPVHVLARKGVTNPVTSIAPQGKVEVNQLDLTMLDYPMLEVDDVLVEMRQSRRYLVKHVTRTELRGVPVHQKIVMSELPRDSIEYRIRVSAPQSPTYY